MLKYLNHTPYIYLAKLIYAWKYKSYQNLWFLMTLHQWCMFDDFNSKIYARIHPKHVFTLRVWFGARDTGNLVCIIIFRWRQVERFCIACVYTEELCCIYDCRLPACLPIHKYICVEIQFGVFYIRRTCKCYVEFTNGIY